MSNKNISYFILYVQVKDLLDSKSQVKTNNQQINSKGPDLQRKLPFNQSKIIKTSIKFSKRLLKLMN